MPPASSRSLWPMLVAWLLCAIFCTRFARAMTHDQVRALRSDTRDLFYHGYDNYMELAFPEDELKPLSCRPQTRNRENPADIGLNDVLGNYSLTLIDSLSTLAILASGSAEKGDKRRPLRDFQDGIKSLVELYGHGTEKKRCGTRACGFDLDSKVQVFETNIRGVGGLLSAHLFANGDLPITGYEPVRKGGKNPGIKWKNGFVYNGQLLNLAYDLGRRLLPAFSTPTNIPYPRVNLRHGADFYHHADGICLPDGSSTPSREITENCAAGAGSLVLEFTVLSRLTGDMRFERVAKRAFWAIWEARSSIGLIGNGIDADTAYWTNPPLSGIGAGMDSFFEYSLKSHILLSNLPYDAQNATHDSPESFLRAWKDAHAAVRRHIYRSNSTEKHPYYAMVDTYTGALRYTWIDNLSAYYPGLLVLAGELEEAIESHLLWSALWTRYSALPERWMVGSSYIDPNFKHWAGRPEFIESTFHLYQATKDPYYLHVGEMTLRDIRRRCWTPCGWTDLSDVQTGEQRDRMESFFLGETAKYLYLLFTENHPLNKLDRPVVFTTEGHPLLIPDSAVHPNYSKGAIRTAERRNGGSSETCAAPPPPLPLTVSNVANRADLFHAAALAQLHTVPVDPSRASPLQQRSKNGPGISFADVRSPTNYTFYPWTLPPSLIPTNGMSSPIVSPVVSTLTFPDLSASTAVGLERGIIKFGAMQKVDSGILINSLSNLRLNMVQESKSLLLPDDNGVLIEQSLGAEFRIHGIANWALGKDERVLLSAEALKGVSPSDPHFTKVKDLEMMDLILDLPTHSGVHERLEDLELENGTLDAIWEELESKLEGMLSSLLSTPSKSTQRLRSPDRTKNPPLASPTRRIYIPAILPAGIGAAPLPSRMDIDASTLAAEGLPYTRIFFLDDTLCQHHLPSSIAKNYQILIVMRGGCSFNDKLANIPAFPPGPDTLQLVIVVSAFDEGKQEHGLIRPLLDKLQLTPHGLERRQPIAMCMIDGTALVPPVSGAKGGDPDGADADDPVRPVEYLDALKRVSTGIGSFDEAGKLAEMRRESVGDGTGRKVDAGALGGIGVKRRYWFESMGVPIGNLLMV